MKLLPTNQKDQIKVVVAIGAVGLGLYYWAYPYEARALELEEARSRVERLEDANLKARREISRGTAKQLRAQAARSRATLDVLRQLVPAAYEVPAVLEEVSTAARRAGLDIASVEPLPMIVGEEFDTYRYKISIAGSYHPLAEFLTNVGSLTRIIAPANLQLEPAPATAATGRRAAADALLKATFEIQTYVAKGSSPAAIPRPSLATADAATDNRS